MKEQIYLSEIVSFFESLAPSSLQENYDNSGLQAGDPAMNVRSVLVTVDVTEEVIDEAIRFGANLVVMHHPLIFGGLKRITGSTSTERILLKSLRNHIALLAVHTNLDNVEGGVNSKIAAKLGLVNCRILQPLKGQLRKLVTFIPSDHLDKVRRSVFEAGAGYIGNYDQCSFNLEGVGTFRGNEVSNPFVGEPGKLHFESEVRFETIYPLWLEKRIIQALLQSHPYEEVAYDIYPLENACPKAGAGVLGELPEPLDEFHFLQRIKETFDIPVIRHSPLLGKTVRKTAICGGAGSSLLKDAIAAEAGFFLTGDIKYHQFFDADDKIVLADMGHFESEQFTKELFYELLTKKFPTFAVRLSEVNTNPVNYFI